MQDFPRREEWSFAFLAAWQEMSQRLRALRKDRQPRLSFAIFASSDLLTVPATQGRGFWSGWRLRVHSSHHILFSPERAERKFGSMDRRRPSRRPPLATQIHGKQGRDRRQTERQTNRAASVSSANLLLFLLLLLLLQCKGVFASMINGPRHVRVTWRKTTRFLAEARRAKPREKKKAWCSSELETFRCLSASARARVGV